MTIEYAKVNSSEGFSYLAEFERAKNRVSEEAGATSRALITALTQRLDRGYKQNSRPAAAIQHSRAIGPSALFASSAHRGR